MSLRTSAFRQVWRLHLGSCTCGRPLGDLGGNDLCRLPAGGRSACLRGHPASQGFRPLLGTLAFQVEGSPVLGKRRAFRDWKMQPFGESYCQCLPLTSGIRKKKGHPSHEGPLGGRGGARVAAAGAPGRRCGGCPGSGWQVCSAGCWRTPHAPWADFTPLRPHSEAAPGCTEGPGWTPRSV